MRARRAAVTGGAGFLGSHLCEALLRQDVEVVCLDNFLTGTPGRTSRTCSDDPALHPARAATSSTSCTCRARSTWCCTSPRPASPIDYLRLPIETLKVGSDRHLARAGAGQGEGRPVRARVHVRGVRRPAGAPAARGLLGPRQPGRPARRLRRGQAVRRGADHGLPRRRGRRHRASCGSSTPTARGCGPDDGRAIPTFIAAGAGAASRSRSPATARRPGRSATSTTPSPASLALADSDHPGPVNIGNPDERSVLQIAEDVIARDRLAVAGGARRPAGRRPRRPPSRHHARARGRSAGSRRCRGRTASRRTVAWFREAGRRQRLTGTGGVARAAPCASQHLLDGDAAAGRGPGSAACGSPRAVAVPQHDVQVAGRSPGPRRDGATGPKSSTDGVGERRGQVGDAGVAAQQQARAADQRRRAPARSRRPAGAARRAARRPPTTSRAQRRPRPGRP